MGFIVHELSTCKIDVVYFANVTSRIRPHVTAPLFLTATGFNHAALINKSEVIFFV